MRVEHSGRGTPAAARSFAGRALGAEVDLAPVTLRATGQTPTIVIVRVSASPFFVLASTETVYVLPFATVRPVTR